MRSLPAAAPAAPVAPAAPPAPAAPATEAAPPAPPVAVSSPEFSPIDVQGTIGEISGGVATEFVGPFIKQPITDFLDAERFPFLGTPYGAVIPGKVAGTVVNQFGGLVGSVIGDALKGSEGEPGIGWKPTPANKLLAGTTKGVVTSWMRMALTEALRPAPQPTPIYAPDVKPIGVEQPPAPPAPKKVLLTDTGVIKGAVTDGVIGMAISTIYDQAVGPLVQRVANLVTGRSDEEVAKPAPLTPGRVVNGLTEEVLGAMLVRSIAYKPLPPSPGTPPPAPGDPSAGTPFAGALGVSILNGIVGAAWSTVYNRGIGESIENGVNQLAGIRTKEEQEKATLPALEHFTRAATRGVAVGATTYLLGNALVNTMATLGASVGGVGGALIAVGGAALIGAVGGSLVDATIGPMLGKLGGQVYSWITGKPAYEQRMEEAAKQPPAPAPAPGPTPGSPVKAPNGNPGTVPAPDAPKAPAVPAPAAPAAGKPKKRRRTGNAAVDRTAPAMRVPPAKLAAIAARG